MPEDIRDAEARRRRAEGDRVREVREATGEKQGIFAVRLTAEAARQGMGWLVYDNTIVSKLENGARALTLDDAVIVAAVDPQQRGRFWLAWDEDANEATARTPRRIYGGRVVEKKTPQRKPGRASGE